MSKTGGLLLAAAWLAVSTPAAAQVTMLKLADIVPGTEVTTVISDGDFEEGSDWTYQGVGLALGDPAPYVTTGLGQGLLFDLTVAIFANAWNHPAVPVSPNTEYVLSGYFWNIGDADDHGEIMIDLNDVPFDVNMGVDFSHEDAAGGYFVYGSFTTGPSTTSVTVRAFYQNVSQGDDTWPTRPIAGVHDNIAVTLASGFSPPLSAPDVPASAPWSLGITVLTFSVAMAIYMLRHRRESRPLRRN